MNNIIKSFDMAWNNLYFRNKIILIILSLPSIYIGIRYVINDLIFLIKYFRK